MIPKAFSLNAPGQVIGSPRDYWAFVPNTLPPKLELGPLLPLLEEAVHAVGNLKGAGHRLPNPHMLVRPFLRREAVLSSRIEGTRTSFSDLLFFEAASQVPTANDVGEVANYVRAVEHGLSRLSELPLSLRLVNEVHGVLMAGAPHSTPGEFRRSQNWIGPPGCTLNEATYVPPPEDNMHACLRDWEKFLHDRSLPVLVQAALAHYQFEAIHPFIDGNGRVGRLMITLLLAERKQLPDPLLYLSAFFERHRSDYYALLLKVSVEGAWVEWIEFFLRGVRTQAEEAVLRIERLLALHAHYRELVRKERTSSGHLLHLVEELFRLPVSSVSDAMKVLGVTFRSAQQNIDRLVKVGILREVTGRQRNRVYLAEEILNVATGDMPDALVGETGVHPARQSEKGTSSGAKT